MRNGFPAKESVIRNRLISAINSVVGGIFSYETHNAVFDGRKHNDYVINMKGFMGRKVPVMRAYIVQNRENDGESAVTIAYDKEHITEKDLKRMRDEIGDAAKIKEVDYKEAESMFFLF